MRLRAATTGDLRVVLSWIDSEAAMVQWSGTGFSWPLNLDQVLPRLADPGTRHLVAVDEQDDPVGFVRLSERPGRVTRVGWVIVRPDRRGTGIGGAFVPAIVAAAFGGRDASGSPERLSLGVLRHNTPARRLYHRAGFRPTGEVTHPQVGSHPWDCIEMTLTRPDLTAGRSGVQPSAARRGLRSARPGPLRSRLLRRVGP